MPIAFRIANLSIAKIIFQPFLYLIKIGINPYIIFFVSIVFIFLLYFLLFYKGDYKLLQEDFEKLSPKKRKELLIFIFGGIFIAFVLFYESLNLFYDEEGLSKYHSFFVDNLLGKIVDDFVLFLNKIGVIK